MLFNKNANWVRISVVFGLLNVLFVAAIALTIGDNITNPIVIEKPNSSDTSTIPAVQVHVNYLGSSNTENEESEEVGFLVSDRSCWDLYDELVGELSIPVLDYKTLVYQTSDNEKYLDKDPDGKYLKSGTIFGDYRNNFEILDANNIIYGHNMADGTKFGVLPKLRLKAPELSGDDLNIYFNSKGFSNIFRICSIYETDLETFNYIQTGFVDDTDKMRFLQTLVNLNECREIDTQIPLNTKLLTLSTCTQNGTHRLVVHAYLTNRTNIIS